MAKIRKYKDYTITPYTREANVFDPLKGISETYAHTRYMVTKPDGNVMADFSSEEAATICIDNHIKETTANPQQLREEILGLKAKQEEFQEEIKTHKRFLDEMAETVDEMAKAIHEITRALEKYEC